MGNSEVNNASIFDFPKYIDKTAYYSVMYSLVMPKMLEVGIITAVIALFANRVVSFVSNYLPWMLICFSVNCFVIEETTMQERHL